VGSLFQEVWDEGGQAARLGNVSFGTRLEETIIPYLSRSIIQSLEDVSWNRRKTACAALIELCDTNILSPPPRATGENKETVTPERTQRFVVRAESSCKILGACVKSIVTTRIWKGKEDLLKAVAKIAGNWISSNIDSYVLLRDREQGNSDIVFPMNPVNLDKESTDLFLGDAWFSKDHGKDAVEEMDVTEDNSSATLLITDAEEESNINFSAGDSLLATDDVEDSSDKDTDNIKPMVSVSFHGLCRLLLEQGIPSEVISLTNADYLSYRASALDSLSKILGSMASDEFTPYLRSAFNILVPRILPLMRNQKVENQEVPPLIIAKCFTCFSTAIFHDIGGTNDIEEFSLPEIANLFKINAGASQSAWTVREAAALAAAKLAERGNYVLLRRIAITEDLLACTSFCLKDRKFWRVRLAGLKIVLSFCSRVRSQRQIGNTVLGSQSKRNRTDDNDSQLIFEAILPFKERFVDFAKACLADNEAQVTAAASEIMTCISWWP